MSLRQLLSALLCVAFLQGATLPRAVAQELIGAAPFRGAQNLGFNAIRSLRPSSWQAKNRALMLSNNSVGLIAAGDYGQAESQLKQALSIAPDSFHALSNMGYLLYKSGRPAEAIAYLESARAMSPTDAAPMVTLGGAYQSSGRLREAVAQYNEYLQRYPYNPDSAFIAGIKAQLEREIQTQGLCHDHGLDGGLSSTSNDYLNASTARYQLRWNQGRKLRVYLAPAESVYGYGQNCRNILLSAFRKWEENGPMSFEFVFDRRYADIDCRWIDNPGLLSAPGEAGEARLEHMNGKLTHCTISLMTLSLDNMRPARDNALYALCLHEIGHALGLVDHSPVAGDIMFCTVSTTNNMVALSERDINTLSRLYQTGPKAQIPGSRIGG